MFYFAASKGWVSYPVAVIKCPLKVFRKENPDDGVYQIRNLSPNKNMHCKVLYDGLCAE